MSDTHKYINSTSTIVSDIYLAASQYMFVSSEACQLENFLSQEKNMVSHSDCNCLEDIAVM